LARTARAAHLRLGPGGGEQRRRGAHPPPAPQAEALADPDRARRRLRHRASAVVKLPRSLQARVLVLALASMLAVWLAAAAFTWREAQGELDELLDGHLAQAAALLIVRQVDEIEEPEDDERIDAPALHRYAPKVAFQVWRKGELVARS